MARKVTLEQFGAALEKIVDEYADSVYKTGIHAVEQATKQAQREVKANSSGIGHGKYSGGWSTQVDKTEISATGYVYNRRPGLPHLLEFGHAKVNGGRTEARPHVQPAQDAVDKVLMDKLKEGLS